MTRPDEFAFIDRLTRRLPTRPDVHTGIGDDAAVLPGPAGMHTLLAADMLVEGRHFFPGDDLYNVGRKALAVNASDIAAMGGQPTFAVVSLGVPESVSMEAAERLYEGLADESASHKIAIVGGDTVSASSLTISVALMGEVAQQRLLRRQGALVGDKLAVTGSLGQAAAGLLLRQRPEVAVPTAVRQRVTLALERPIARVQAGQELAQGLATAAIDVSDGIAGDVRRLCRASGVGAVIDVEALPISDDVRTVAAAAGVDPVQLALTGGEDFELLFTLGRYRSGRHRLPAARTSYTIIGEIVPAHGGLSLRRRDGTLAPLEDSGFRHF